MTQKTNLWHLRKKRKLSARALSETTAVPEKVIYELEHGLKRANVKYVLALAGFFQVSVGTLMALYEGGGSR